MSVSGSLLERLAPDEAWRYTPVAELVRALDDAVAAPAALPGFDRRTVDELAGDHRGPRVVFVNGAYVPYLSDTDGLPAGVWCGGSEGLRRRAAAQVPLPERDDDFLAANRAARRDIAVVIVDPDTAVDEIVHVVHLAAPGDATSLDHPATLVDVGPGGRVTVVETFAGIAGRSFTNASTTVLAGAGATVGYHRVQDGASEALHVGHTYIDQATGSEVRVTSIQLGAAIARSAIDVRLGGADARIDLDGLYLPVGHMRHDNVVTVDHVAPRGTSVQHLKGIIDDHARGSFSGRVIVRPGAFATDASQSNRNLLLRPTAQADTRPWLEINADDVRCVHGATVGRLDDDALFYLRSRGIPFAEARSLLVAAFAGEIIDAITVSTLRERVADAFAGIARGEREGRRS
jgi:Fe-S cluster assembly protein SufD